MSGRKEHGHQGDVAGVSPQRHPKGWPNPGGGDTPPGSLFTCPATDNPWRRVEHDGDAYLVRSTQGYTWISRIADREMWLLADANVPAHFRAAPEIQGDMFQ